MKIAENTICLSLKFSRLGDTRTADASAITVDADKEMLRVTKTLFQSAEYAAIQRHDGLVKRYLMHRALPSLFRGGVYLVPNELVNEIESYLKAAKKDRDALVAQFIAIYPQLIAKAVTTLRTLFRADEYPEPAELLALFKMTWRYISLDVPTKLQTVSEQVFEQEKAKAEGEWVEAMEEIKKLLRAQMLALVEDMTKKLAPAEEGKRKSMRTDCADKIKEFMSLFEVRNIADDSALKGIVSQAKALLRGVDGQALKEDWKLKEQVTKGFEKIKTELSGMVVNKPSRLIRFEDE